jgi:hypothetical protein
VGALVVSGCGAQDGAALAKQACGYVNSSIALYQSSLSKKNSADATHLQDEAYNELQLGLQPASLAAGDDQQWQALQTTISETSRVPEGVLVSALQLQCAAADGGAQVQAPGATPVT